MAVFTKVVEVLQMVLIIIINIFWLYHFVISISGLVKTRDKKLLINKKHRFLIIIPAHNEEAVVGNLVDSINKIDYDKSLYDTYVIADNCTDNTYEVAKEHGAIAVKRDDPTKKTKGYALDWFLTDIFKKGLDKNYDAIVIFDADNIVDSNFLNMMNKSLCQGEKVVQGYRDIKNPKDSWVSGGYAIFYWMMHRFYHQARYNIGLTPLLNGTAFLVRMDVIAKKGWKTKTLTEDIEFSLQTVLDGERLGWQRDAIVYDEQPTTFKQSWTQRERWTVGHLQCIKIYTKDMLKSVSKWKKMANFDTFLYLIGVPMFLVSILLVIINTILYFVNSIGLKDLLFNYALYFVSIFLLPLLAAIMTVIVEKKSFKDLKKGVIGFPIFMISWLLINIKALVKPNTKWEKIQHVKSVKIEDIQK